MDIKRRYIMRKDEVKEIKEKLEKLIGKEIDTLFGKSVEKIVTDTYELFAENKIIIAFKKGGNILPSLQALNKNMTHLPIVIVDMGAVSFVTNGADIMSPGIRKIPEGMKKGDVVVIIDEKFGKALAVGELLFDSDEIKEMKKGKVIRNIHYVNDEIWSLKL